nr:hypothetical protein [Oceanococcus sp. HetDA_MAG_MS8]
MAEYSIGFAEKLIEAAQSITLGCEQSIDAGRTVLYLSLLSSEISLKALLEHAGKPIPDIIRCQHRLADLLKETDKCFVHTVIVAGGTQRRWIPATSIRALTFEDRGAKSTVGAFLNSENRGASKYPNEVRYGDRLMHFPPTAALSAATLIVDWARRHWEHFRLAPLMESP